MKKTGKDVSHCRSSFLVKEKDEQGFFNSIVHRKAKR
jgi:hypothetical protein